MKMWLILGVDTGLDWPVGETTVQFEGRTFVLRPPEGTHAADIRTQYEYPAEREGAYEAVFRFLSYLSWWQHRPAAIGEELTFSSPMGRVANRGESPLLCQDFRLPEGACLPKDRKAIVAISLYREAISVRSIPYEFLGYFKIINSRYDGWTDQVTWINHAMSLLTDRKAIKRISELKTTESDIGKYLYGQGRCAVAHAFKDPVADPDAPQDLLRLTADMPLARALAEYLIDHEYNVRWRESSSSNPRLE